MCSYNVLAHWNYANQVNLYGETQKWFQREVLPVCGETRWTIALSELENKLKSKVFFLLFFLQFLEC